VILLACDHAAVELKNHLAERLRAAGLSVEDLGVHDRSSVDYPDLAHLLAARVAADDDCRGLLICGTGLGMSMTANRHPGVRAAVCHDAYTAEMARRHNNANVLCLGARVLGDGVAEQIAEIFFSTPFDGGRHERRVAKIEHPPEAP
jgi:ribose 5-phosphate isomerase B